jgi:hypothetical protein
LQSLADFSLAGFQVTKRVLRVNRINFKAEAMQGFEYRPRADKKFDARC